MTASASKRPVVWLALGAAIVLGGDLTAPAAWAGPDGGLVTRTLAWTGDDKLGVAVNGHVRYVQGANAKVQITGPRELVDHIIVDHGVIRSDYRNWWEGVRWGWGPSSDLRILVVAPHLDKASVSGSADLDLGQLKQNELDLGVSGSGRVSASGPIRTLRLHVSGSGGAKLSGLSADEMQASLSGSGWIEAAGAARSLSLDISGSGHANLGALAVDNAKASLSGSGGAQLSPKATADLAVSGSGSVRLLSRPAQLSMYRSGSGRIIQADWTH